VRLLEGLVRRDLIVPERSTITGDDSFRFRHILIRDAAYASLPKAERAQLHERFASWLEDSFADRLAEVEEIIGYHLEQAHTLSAALGRGRTDLPQRAAVPLSAAGRRALARVDLRAAISLLERARSLSPPDAPDHRRHGLELATALHRAGEFDQASAVLQDVEAAAAVAQDDLVLAHARLDLAQSRAWADPEGAAAKAQLVAKAAMPVFEAAGDHLGIGKALMLQADRDRMQTRYKPFREAYEHALKHLRAARNRYWETYALVFIADAVTLGPTPIPEAITRLHEIGGRATESLWLQAQVRIRTARLLALVGREPEALEAEAQGRATLHDLASELDLLWSAWHSGGVLHQLGQLDLAEQVLQESNEICERSGERGLRSTILAELADVLLDKMRPNEARRIALSAIEIGSSDDYLTLILGHRTLARIHARRGDPAAETTARRVVELAEQTDMLWLQGEQWEALGEVLLSEGRCEEAEDAFSHALDRYQRKGATALADRVRSRLTDREVTPANRVPGSGPPAGTSAG
jgi:tetratricopeptide (TPR) repeat protein